MHQTFFDIIYKNFYDTAQKEFEDVKLLLSENFPFPSIEFEPKIEVKIPIPKKIDNGIIYSSCFFGNSSKELTVVWSLFLATVYHLAAHVAVSDYSLYSRWARNKTPKKFWKVINFIEDDAVERYLSSALPEVWNNLLMIRQHYEEGHTLENSKYSLKIGSQIIDSIKENMSKEVLPCFDADHKNRRLNWASELYNHQQILHEETPFYHEQHNFKQSLLWKQNKMEFSPIGQFKNTVNKLNYLYFEEKDRIQKIVHAIRKDTVGLNFDNIVFPNEDIYEYFKLKKKNKKIVNKIREQIRIVQNNSEDPRINYYGEFDMELAIQAIASHSENYAEVFNKHDEQRIEETWTILIDNSASLRLRFEPVKDFMLCLAEASDELTGLSRSWSLYSYDQKFSILKDHKEKYSQDVRARIGGLKSGGLSHTPEAILLSGRILSKIPVDIKHLFVFTDDFPTGLWNQDKRLYLSIKEVERLGVEVIGIGLTPHIQKYFTDSCWGNNMRELMSKFIRMYRMKSNKFL